MSDNIERANVPVDTRGHFAANTARCCLRF